TTSCECNQNLQITMKSLFSCYRHHRSIHSFPTRRSSDLFSKHLTYRALAETLRARFYLRLAGADHRVNSAEVLALSGIDRFEGFSWIAFVLKSIEPADIPVLTDRPPESPRQRCVEEAWIQNQHRYFTVKVAVLEKRSRRIDRL